ncbi:SusC/RagA family TonB-linked outer membrane protein [Flavobacterium sp. TMP13]|uniref:SusC/RagA family TonB-linked outer membrane protein n=1 Tax=Flavobacterium sp. TMP13 TaxID=3425950 RepID=UPI003D76EAB1
MKNNLFRNFLLMGVFLLCGFAQAQSITGTVSETLGPLPGASILVKGTNNSTQTDFDGRYNLSNVSKDAVLVITYIGFVKQEVAVSGRATINVVLKEDAQSLDEVVVVAYGTSTKKDLTGSVATIKSEQLTSFPSTTVDQALQGKTAGVQVTQNSGAPGASMSVNIRGIGSFGNTTPLYVIDGFPTQDISFLNPNDIASITVLKDASASALYGVRASNGVVIIETRGGTRNNMVVSVDTWTGVRASPKNIEMLNVQEFANYATQIGTAQGKALLPEWSNPSALRNVDWQDYAFKSALSQSVNVSVRGGSDKMRAAFTAGLLDQDGIALASSYKRYNVGLNMDADITDKFKVKTDLKYIYSEQFQNLTPGYYNLLKVFANVPYLSGSTDTNVPYDGRGNYGAFTNSELIAPSSNVLAGALRPDNDNGKNVVLGNFSAEYDIIPGLSAKANLSFQSQNYAGWNFAPSYFATTNDKNPTASYSITQNTSNEYIAEGILDYNKLFGKHKVGVLAGISSQQTKFKSVYVNGRGFLNNEIRDMSQAATITDRSGTSGTSTLASTFARLNYSYNNKYYVTATVRRDGVGDRFGANNLYGVFPSFAGGWNIDEEEFMKNSGFNVLKLRGSWGETGSFLGIGPFEYLGNYNNGTSNDDAGYVFGGNLAQGLQPVSLANPDLKWETQIQTNIGIDIEVLNKRLYLTADWFNKEASDFLFQQAIPSQTGFTTKSINGGNVTNKGIELIVGYRKTEGEFTWDVSANFTKIKNNIQELVGSNPYVIFDTDFAPGFVDNWQGVTRSYVGNNVGTFYGYRAEGIFQTKGEIDALNAAAPGGLYQAAGTAPGDRKFRDLNGDKKITGEDREIIGSPFPDFYGGVNFTAQYKGFDLGIELYGSYGNDILNFARVELETFGGYGLTNAYSNISKEYRNQAWTPENKSNTYSRAVIEDVNKNNRVSDHYVEDGSYLRLRNIKLGYSLPSEFIANVGLTAAKFYISSQNPFTLTKYTGWDPEIGEVRDNNGKVGVQARGIDNGAYPITKSFTLGVNLQF